LYRILALTIFLIVYGSLYPWKLHAPPPHALDVFWRDWPDELNRFVLRDAGVNVLLYIPLGIFGFLSCRQRRGGFFSVLAATLLALIVSTGVELLQLCDATRTSSVFDVICNVIGAAIGIALGYFYSEQIAHTVERAGHALSRGPAGALLLLACWISYQLCPLFPYLSRTAIREKFAALLHPATLSPAVAISTCIEWLALAALVESFAGRRSARLLPLLLWVFSFRLLIYGRTVTPAELIGAVVACFVWSRWLIHHSRRAALVAWLVIAGLILQGLAPYRLQASPSSFSWIPFQAMLEGEQDTGLIVLLRKSFWYGAPIWLFRRAGHGIWLPACAVAGLLALIEFAQRYLPGRTPEITDPLLALLLACVLRLLERQRTRSETAVPGPHHLLE
jgi:VanZ family protein